MARRILDLASVTALTLGLLTMASVARRGPAAAFPRTQPRQQAGDTAAAATKNADPHGTHVEHPTELPVRDWKDILKRTIAGISADRILTEAAGVTFYGLLALFPALAATISIFGLFADPHAIGDQLQALGGVIPGGGMDILKQQIGALTSAPSQALGFGVIFGLLTSIWSANAAMKAMFDALNVVYEVPEKRSYLWLTLRSLLFTVGAIVFAIVAVFAVLVIPAVTEWLESPLVDFVLSVGRWPAMLVLLTLVLAVLYRYGPCRDHAPWRWVSWGGAFAAIAWLVVSAAFSYYAANFGSYNKTYGSLGAVVGFMTWIWLSTTVVLIGAELDAQMERQARPS